MRNHIEQLERASSQAQARGEPLVLWPEDLALGNYLYRYLPRIDGSPSLDSWSVGRGVTEEDRPYKVGYAYAVIPYHYSGGDILVEYRKA